MNKLALTAAAVLAGLSASSALADSKTITVDTFTGVEITSGIRANIAVGGPLSVVAESNNAADLNDLRFEVRNGVFHAWYDWNIFGAFDFSGRDITLTITVPTLESVEATSGSTVEAMGLAAGDLVLKSTSGSTLRAAGITATAYKVEVTTGSSMSISGTCESLDAEVTTGASLTAKDVACADVWAEVTTGASATVTANGTIGGEVTTGGSLTVYGGPEVKHLETTTGGSTNFPG